MKEIFELLNAAAEEGKVDKSKVEDFKTSYESRKFTQEDLNKHIADRAKREEEKYKPQVEELTTLKEQLGDKSVEDLVSQLEEKDSTINELSEFKTNVEQKEKENELKSKIDEITGDVKLPDAYKKQIELSEDEEALKQNVESIVEQYKNDMKEAGATSIGGATSPAGGSNDIDSLDATSLLYEGIKESRSQ